MKNGKFTECFWKASFFIPRILMPSKATFLKDSHISKETKPVCVVPYWKKILWKELCLVKKAFSLPICGAPRWNQFLIKRSNCQHKGNCSLAKTKQEKPQGKRLDFGEENKGRNGVWKEMLPQSKENLSTDSLFPWKMLLWDMDKQVVVVSRVQEDPQIQ